MKKHLFGLLLAMFLAVGLLPTVAAAETASNVQYRNYDAASGIWNDSEICPSATVVTDTDLTWGDDGNDGWYVVNSNVAMPSRVVVNGNVHLILANGCTLTVNGGIQVQDNDNNPNTPSTNSLTICAQSTGNNMGKLIAQNVGEYDAGIGGNGYNGKDKDGGHGGTVTINGGYMESESHYGAGIGGGGHSDNETGGEGGTITINGGVITITGRSTETTCYGGAGIGGGFSAIGGNGGDILINGGTVAVNNIYDGAGIGGGGGFSIGGDGGNITINGGSIQSGSSAGAGIGGGGGVGTRGGEGGNITITGGSVIATSQDNGAGIGGGRSGNRGQGGAGGQISITGGNVIAISKALDTGDLEDGAGIGGGAAWDGGNGGTVAIGGGIVTATSQGKGAGIGGGYSSRSYGDYTGGNGGIVTITGGTVTATSQGNGEGIGGGSYRNSTNGTEDSGTFQTNDGNAVLFASSIGDKSNIGNWSGVIFEGNEGKVYGSSVKPVADFTIDSGKTLLIPENTTLDISRVSAVNEGSVYVNGTLRGSPLGGNLYYPLVITGGIADKAHPYGNKTYGKAGETITLTGTDIPVGHKAIWNATPTVTFAGDSFSMPTEKVTITATYAPKTYQITYNMNGGDSVSSGTYTYGTPATLPNDVKKSGYIFKGWYASSALTGDPVTAIGTTETGDKSFWAKWEANTYTVAFDTDGGSAIADKTMQWEDTVLTGVATPAKTGWEFLGWKYNDTPVNANTKYSGLGVADTVQYVRLTAQWKDVAAPVISGVENGKTYCLTCTVTVSDNVGVDSVTVDGVAVTLDSNNQFTLSPKDTSQTIIARDAAGNISAEMSVTVNSEHKGGTATCTKKATCIHCGTQYGPLDRNKHDLEYIPAKGATVTATGNKEYWHCKDCRKYFSDANGTNNTTLSDTIISKLPPSIINGSGQSLTAGEWKELTFRSNAAFADFVRVELDGLTVESSRYTVKEGSTIVSLKADYVRTLSAGEHTLSIVSTNGTATTPFTVHAPAASDNSQASPEGNVSASVNTPSANKNPLSVPPTGDDSPLGLWVVALVVSGVLLNILGVVLKKRRSKK